MRLLSPSRTGGKQKKALRLFKQLEFLVVGRALRLPVQVGQANNKKASDALALQFQVRALLRSLGAHTLAREVRVEWNPRLKTCAGRADYREKLILLNPRLRDLVAVSTQPHFECTNGAIRDSRIATESCVGMVADEVDRTL